MGKRNTEKRIQAINLHKQGFSRKQISEMLGVGQESIKTWTYMYRNGQKDLLAERPCHKIYSQELNMEAVQAHVRDSRTITEVTATYGILDPSALKR